MTCRRDLKLTGFVDTSMLDLEVFEMADKSVRYTPEFKRQIVDLVRSGRTPASLSKDFGPTAWSIALWVKRSRRDNGTGDGGLTTAEREELSRLRRENRKLKEQQEILSKAAAWFATESGTSKRSSDS
jgi:transposase